MIWTFCPCFTAPAHFLTDHSFQLAALCRSMFLTTRVFCLRLSRYWMCASHDLHARFSSRSLSLRRLFFITTSWSCFSLFRRSWRSVCCIKATKPFCSWCRVITLTTLATCAWRLSPSIASMQLMHFMRHIDSVNLFHPFANKTFFFLSNKLRRHHRRWDCALSCRALLREKVFHTRNERNLGFTRSLLNITLKRLKIWAYRNAFILTAEVSIIVTCLHREKRECTTQTSFFLKTPVMIIIPWLTCTILWCFSFSCSMWTLLCHTWNPLAIGLESISFVVSLFSTFVLALYRIIPSIACSKESSSFFSLFFTLVKSFSSTSWMDLCISLIKSMTECLFLCLLNLDSASVSLPRSLRIDELLLCWGNFCESSKSSSTNEPLRDSLRLLLLIRRVSVTVNVRRCQQHRSFWKLDFGRATRRT